MSPTNDMKARLFVDMDGTLAVWKQAACFEDLLQPGYFRDLPPYQTVLDAVKILCNTKPELDVYALSAYMPENPYAVHEKNAWLDAYLPEIDSEHRIFVACGSSKARAAANRLKTPCIDNSFMLLDDYSVNLHEWKANRGSCIKLRNGINGNGGTWKGESVTRFDTAENIADRIWSILNEDGSLFQDGVHDTHEEFLLLTLFFEHEFNEMDIRCARVSYTSSDAEIKACFLHAVHKRFGLMDPAAERLWLSNKSNKVYLLQTIHGIA